MSKSETKSRTRPGGAAKRGPGRRRSTTFPESFLPIVDGIDYDVLDELAGYAIRRAQIAIYTDFFAAVDDPDITPARFANLVIIGANPGLRQVEIARVQGVAKPGATALIDFWEKRGFVERRASPGDRRSNGIYLTKKGVRGLRELKGRVKKHDRKMTRVLSREARKQLMASLMKIALHTR